MSLKDELKPFTGKKRRFMLMRVAEIEAEVARKMCDIPLGTYHGWLNSEDFAVMYRRVEEFTIEYKSEAIQMLRRDNQLSAVILEEQIINKMREEVTTGEYNLLRTNLARDVYTRLMGDLDAAAIKSGSDGVTFIDKVAILMGREQPMLAPVDLPPVMTATTVANAPAIEEVTTEGT